MVYRGPYKVRVDGKAMPRIEHPNDAIVRVTLTAICGSDLHLDQGMMPDTRVGTTFGHEFIGIIDQVGPSVQNLKVGDRVTVPFNVFCGSWWFCAAGSTRTATTSTPTPRRSAASTATPTPAAGTTAASPSTYACPSPTSGRA